MYLLEMGQIEQDIARQAMRFGNPLPDRIANAPELQLGLGLYLEAFFDLDGERTHAMGLKSIPWSSIKNYAVAYDFDEEQTEDLIYFIKQMDAEHIKALDKKTPKPKKGR